MPREIIGVPFKIYTLPTANLVPARLYWTILIAFSSMYRPISSVSTDKRDGMPPTVHEDDWLTKLLYDWSACLMTYNYDAALFLDGVFPIALPLLLATAQAQAEVSSVGISILFRGRT